MISKEVLIKTEEYWLETLQNEVYRMIAGYIEKEGITQNQFAEKLNVSKGYISQIMNGNFNYTLKKLIELSLAVGKAPVLEFKSFDDITKSTLKEAISQEETKLNKVAEPKVKYKS